MKENERKEDEVKAMEEKYQHDLKKQNNNGSKRRMGRDINENVKR